MTFRLMTIAALALPLTASIAAAQDEVDLPSPGVAPVSAPENPGPPDRDGSAVSVRVATVERGALNAWISGEGTARAVRREFLSFESAGRIAFVDDLREGDRVKKGHVIAMQEQARSAAEIANAEASIANARAGITSAEAGIIDAQTQVQVSDANVFEAQANLDLAQKTFDRFATLLAQASASQQEYDEAAARLAQAQAAASKAQHQAQAVRAQIETARSQLLTANSQLSTADAQLATARIGERESRLISPMDGIIAHLNIEQGFYFTPQIVQTNSEQAALDTIPVVIIDPSDFEIRVDVPAYEYDRVKRGARTLIEARARRRQSPGGGFEDEAVGPSQDPDVYETQGGVYAVSPSFDPATRTFQVKIRTTKGARRLLDGEFVSVWIAGPESPDAVTIPRGATRFSGGRLYVFVYDEESETVERVEIETGAQNDNRIEVLSGLEPGMKVVTEGRSQIGDGDRVRVIGTR